MGYGIGLPSRTRYGFLHGRRSRRVGRSGQLLQTRRHPLALAWPTRNSMSPEPQPQAVRWNIERERRRRRCGDGARRRQRLICFDDLFGSHRCPGCENQ